MMAAGAALGTGLTTAGAQAAKEGEKTMLQVAMLSKWHVHAEGYARELAAMDDVRLTAVWDEDPERGAAWAKVLDVPFEPSLGAILGRDDVDAVACDAPSNMHPEVLVAAANAGKHVFTEKVMALTVAECNQISDAVRKAGVKFGISFPYRTRPINLYAHKALEEGLLGALTFFRVRVAHNGASGEWLPPHFWEPETTGGGAMMDLGAHPMYLSRWVGGQPKKISSTFTRMTDHELEDNAVSVIEFEGGVIGVSETSFMSTFSPFTFELSGTEGCLIAGGPDENVRIRSNKLGGRWTTIEELPEALPSPIRLWVEGVLYDKPIPFGLEEGTQLTELMEYAYKSYREGCQVTIPPR